MDKKVVNAAEILAAKYGVPLATLLAVIEVESGGQIFALVDGKQEPVIRYESHYFYQRLTGFAQEQAIKQGLASPHAGAVANPASQQSRWDKLLKPAMKIDRAAALESCSWGLGQVMASNWKKLGYGNVDELVASTRENVEGQIELMLRYCKAFNLIDKLKRGDFTGFARGYNGPAQHGYDAKIEAAAKRYAKIYSAKQTVDGVPTTDRKQTVAISSMLRSGTSGAKVREAQTLLHRAGLPIEVDGDYGPATEAAVIKFQAAHNNLTPDGIIGPATWAALDSFRVDPSEAIGNRSPMQAFVQTVKGRQGAAATVGGTALTSIIEPAKNALLPLIGSSGFVDNIYTILTVAGVLLALGGIAWGAWGWFKTNQTHGVAA